MLKKQFIVVSRGFGDETSIQALRDPSSGNVTFAEVDDALELIKRDLTERGVKSRTVDSFIRSAAECRVSVIHHAPDAPDMYYRILVANFTSNGAPITPGLRVLDYDQRKGHVVAPQFMATSSLAPGGEYFDGWYHVEAEGGSTRRFNGSRLKAL